MAIAFDAQASSTGSGTTLTYSHTCTGSNLILIVGIQTYLASAGGITISSVTYNGVAMTSFGTLQRTLNAEYQYMYYLVAPATGAHNIVITTTTAMDYIGGSSASYTGANQTGLPDSYTTYAAQTSTAVTTTTTTIANNCWLMGFYVSDGGGGWTAGTNTTGRATAGNAQFFDSNSVQTPAGSHSMTATHNNFILSGQMISIAPFVPVNSGASFLAFM